MVDNRKLAIISIAGNIFVIREILDRFRGDFQTEDTQP